jgi:serpin B
MRRVITALFLTASASLLAAPSDGLKDLTASHTGFAFSLYPTIDVPNENNAFSPFSISTCLSMVYLGARGDTESQMQKVLHLNINRKSIGRDSYLLSQSLQSAKGVEHSYQLSNVNALWIDQSTFLLTDFRYAIEKQFKARLSHINFSEKTNALSTINQWVAEQTQGKIPAILTPGDIDALTRLVLTNAVYFQGTWVSPFNPKTTQDWPFHPSVDSSTPVKMMDQTLFIPYYENELIQAAALPFAGKASSGGDLAFVVLLPKSADNFATMLSELPRVFSEWISSLSSKRVALKLPKFTINTRLSLGDALEQLGMEDAFDSAANFAGIDGMRTLFLSKVIHQTFFCLDEQGVVAAATTTAPLGVTSLPETSSPIALTIDHPFLFFIIDLKSQEMLFMGKVVQPSL